MGGGANSSGVAGAGGRKTICLSYGGIHPPNSPLPPLEWERRGNPPCFRPSAAQHISVQSNPCVPTKKALNFYFLPFVRPAAVPAPTMPAFPPASTGAHVWCCTTLFCTMLPQFTLVRGLHKDFRFSCACTQTYTDPDPDTHRDTDTHTDTQTHRHTQTRSSEPVCQTLDCKAIC